MLNVETNQDWQKRHLGYPRSNPSGLPQREPREGYGHNEGVTLVLPGAHVHQNTPKCCLNAISWAQLKSTGSEFEGEIKQETNQGKLNTPHVFCIQAPKNAF